MTDRFLHHPRIRRDHWGRLVYVYEDGTVIPVVAGAKDTATFDQDSFQGFNDDGDHDTATAIAAVNNNWTQTVDAIFHMRFLLQNETAFDDANHRMDLQYNLNGAGWMDVNAIGSNVVRAAVSAFLTDNADTALRIGLGTNVVPNEGADESTGSAGGNALDWPAAAGREVESVFSVRIIGDDVSDGDTLELRITNKGAAYNTYTNTPSITVDKPSAEFFEAARQLGTTQPYIQPPEVIAY